MTTMEQKQQAIRHNKRMQLINDYHRKATIINLSVEEASAILEEDPARVLVMDTETTGLNPLDDDVLQLCQMTGEITWINEMYGSHRAEWPIAEAINHIPPAAVDSIDPLDDDVIWLGRITQTIRRARVIVGYNVWFDLDFLIAAGVGVPQTVTVCDVMYEYKHKYNIEKWVKMVDVASHYGIDTKGQHEAEADCIMTLKILRRMAGGINCHQGRRP